MTYSLKTPESYAKKLGKFLKTHPELIAPYKKTVELLETNPYHPSLRLHTLQGNLKNFHSVSINLKYRIVINFIIEDQQIILIDVNKHYE
jgi:mRNA-degrading endonuclease YafQ of YafQ-DinJ toxin-antitoxin module